MSDEAPLVAEPSAEIGSRLLAEGLAEQDVDRIGLALRHDVVVFPQRRDDDGALEWRVYGSGDEARPYRVHLFSSAATMAAALRDGEGREFALVGRAELAGFLAEYGDRIDRVVFDPAGPHPMSAVPDDVAILLPDPPGGDDPELWAGTAGARDSLDVLPSVAELGDGRIEALELDLTEDWVVVDVELSGPRIDEILSRSVVGLKANRALRADLVRWLKRATSTAQAGGARFIAFLLMRPDSVPLALNLTMYWHELGPESGGVSHLDRVAERLRSTLDEGDELLGADTDAGPLLRHTRIRSGTAELEATSVPMLEIDYWLRFPDGRGLAMLSFVSPHTDIREHLTRLAERIVLHGQWIVERESAPTGDGERSPS